MAIDLKSLRRAMEDLNNLPQTAIVQDHPDKSLPAFIGENTKRAREIIQDVINLIETTATLESLIRERERERMNKF